MIQTNLFLIILLIFLVIIFWIYFFGYKFDYFLNINDFAPIPFIYNSQLRYFNDIPSGYDSSTRSYMNPYFAQQVAQGLDTN